GSISETVTEEVAARLQSPDLVLAEVLHPDGRPPAQLRLSDVPAAEKLEKFVEDVKFGIYPLTAYAARQPPPPRPRAISPELAESVKSVTPEPVDVENRRVVNMMCNVKPKDSGADLSMTLLLRMDDKMNRQLTCLVSELDSALLLAHELVHFGFINEADREKIATLIEDTLRTCFNKQLLSPTGNNGMNSATVPAQVISGMPVMPGMPGMHPMPGMPGVQSVVPGMPMMQTMPAMVPLQHMGPPPVTAPMTVPSSNAMLPPSMYPMPSHDHVSMAATVHSAGS
ncbi:Nuclear receptor-binding protein homolog, partial [Gryllus bimaculatus]